MGKKLLNFKVSGSFDRTLEILKESINVAKWESLWRYGEMGVEALRNATPVDSGLTRDSWSYEVKKTDKEIAIIFKNSNVVKDYFNVAIMLQYGHATGNGGYVKGIDYINPALKPVFERMANELWKETIGG